MVLPSSRVGIETRSTQTSTPPPPIPSLSPAIALSSHQSMGSHTVSQEKEGSCLSWCWQKICSFFTYLYNLLCCRSTPVKPLPSTQPPSSPPSSPQQKVEEVGSSFLSSQSGTNTFSPPTSPLEIPQPSIPKEEVSSSLSSQSNTNKPSPPTSSPEIPKTSLPSDEQYSTPGKLSPMQEKAISFIEDSTLDLDNPGYDPTNIDNADNTEGFQSFFFKQKIWILFELTLSKRNIPLDKIQIFIDSALEDKTLANAEKQILRTHREDPTKLHEKLKLTVQQPGYNLDSLPQSFPWAERIIDLELIGKPNRVMAFYLATFSPYPEIEKLEFLLTLVANKNRSVEYNVILNIFLEAIEKFLDPNELSIPRQYRNKDAELNDYLKNLLKNANEKLACASTTVKPS